MMTPELANTIRTLRAAGWAVILWTPEELNGADPSDIEDQSIQFASDYLIPDQSEDDTDNPDYSPADRFQLGE